MELRPFEDADEDAVVALWQRCGLIRPWNDPHKDIARKRAVQRELFLVGLVEGTVVATAMAGYDGHRGWVYYLAVDPAHRRRGYAREMMAAVEARLRALGCAKINLLIRHDNREARGFYERIGFHENAT